MKGTGRVLIWISQQCLDKMNSGHETDIYWFKKVYRYLTEERGWKIMEIVADTQMSHLTVKSLINATKKDIPKLRASTIARLQDFVKRWREEVDDDLDDVAETAEGIRHMIEENGNGKNMESVEVKPMTLGEADEYDLLRALSKIEKLSLNITISMN